VTVLSAKTCCIILFTEEQFFIYFMNIILKWGIFDSSEAFLGGRFRIPSQKSAWIKHWWAVVSLCGTSWERSARGQGRLTMPPPDWPTSMKEKYHSPKENKKA